MTTLGERLKIARERKGYTQVDVKNRTNINNKTLSGYEKGVSEPDTKTLSILAELYEVSYRWLLTGKGSMLEDSSDDNSKRNEVIEKIKTEFADADLMFHDLSKMTADQLEEVYNFIKYQLSKGE